MVQHSHRDSHRPDTSSPEACMMIVRAGSDSFIAAPTSPSSSSTTRTMVHHPTTRTHRMSHLISPASTGHAHSRPHDTSPPEPCVQVGRLLTPCRPTPRRLTPRLMRHGISRGSWSCTLVMHIRGHWSCTFAGSTSHQPPTRRGTPAPSAHRRTDLQSLANSPTHRTPLQSRPLAILRAF